MDTNDRQAIEGLFNKLSDVERQSEPRDGEAESFIQERIAGQPAAPYFMAQTIVVQEQALNAAQQRIEELEYEAANRPAPSGGLLSGLFGGGKQPEARPASRPQTANVGGPWGQQGQSGQQQGGMMPSRGGGGGFLAGAAQTAMGVAGGVLLGNAIAGMFGGSDANAAETPAEEPAAEPAADDSGGMDDMGGDMEF